MNINSFYIGEKKNNYYGTNNRILFSYINNLKNHVKKRLANNKVKKVINVYQMKYKNGNLSQGLGDFLRGSITLSLLCNMLNLKFDIDFNNHIIGNYIYSNTEDKASINYENVKLVGINYKFYYDIEEIIKHIINTNEEICYLMTTFSFEQESLFIPICKITNSDLIRKLSPKPEINDNINKIFSDNNLETNQYGVIHIRAGDGFLVNKHIENDYIYSFFNFIINKLREHNDVNSTKYIIISDNIYLKNYIKQSNNNFITINNVLPVHLAYGELNGSNVLWTLIDFFLIARSSKIVSFSRYTHGSGFSKWASFIFNKPFYQYIHTEINSKFTNLISKINN